MLRPPPLRDPRYVQLAILSAYAVTAREVFHFERTHLTTLTCVATAVGLDLVYGKLVYKKLLFPLSAMIIGLACSLLLDAQSSWPYVLAAALGVSSKAFLTHRGRHLFNPANFAVVVLLALLPTHVTGMPHLFAGHLAPAIVFAVLGLATVIYARQLELPLAWLVGFAAFALVRGSLRHANPVIMLLPMLGPGFLLYTFHMISDPATSPKTRRWRVIVGLALAFGDAVFRHAEIPYGFFYALFGVSAFMPWIRLRESGTITPMAPPAPAVRIEREAA